MALAHERAKPWSMDDIKLLIYHIFFFWKRKSMGVSHVRWKNRMGLWMGWDGMDGVE